MIALCVTLCEKTDRKTLYANRIFEIPDDLLKQFSLRITHGKLVDHEIHRHMI